VSVFGASIVPERPRLLVVLSRTNYTTELVAAAGTLSVTVLAEGQAHLLEPLGLHSGRDVPKLATLEHELTRTGDPTFPGSSGSLACEVLRSFDFGDSTAFLAAVRERTENGLPPLAWQTAKDIVGADFLARWAEKSVREQAAAREAMHWRE
jgi:flavin reductase (DIM6/NTAB) family NADH-FMN oxidoreductase RutF